MEIRFAEQPDLDAVHALIERVIDTSYATVYSPRALEAFRRYHAPARVAERIVGGSVVVGEENGEPVATGSLVGHEVFAVFVAPERQGEGLGARVMDALEQRALATGHDRITLDASLTALDFYTRRGYTLREMVRMDVGDGEHLDWYPADKPLR